MQAVEFGSDDAAQADDQVPFAHHDRRWPGAYVSPDHFQSLITIQIFLAVTAGGVGRPLGAVIGAYAVVVFLEATRFIADMLPGLQPVQLAAVREALVGSALLLVLFFKPTGLLAERIVPMAKRT